MRQHEKAGPCGPLDGDPLWGLSRDDLELIDQVVRDAMRDRRTVPLRAAGDE